MTPATIATAPSIPPMQASVSMATTRRARKGDRPPTPAGRAPSSVGSRPNSGLVDEFRNGSHRKVSAAT